jgi:hypothetical protein
VDPSQANEIISIFGISFCLQSPNVWEGGRLWEGGDLERLSLVDDEEPIKPQEVFSHVSVVNKSKVIVIGGESGLFASRDI